MKPPRDGTNEANNPKLLDSGLVDCIPQIGKCPNPCGDNCYYNQAFYRTLDKPLFPNASRVNKQRLLVRVNSGHDSNHDRDFVIASTAKYHCRFFNTSIPRFDFPAPVVFTCNPDENKPPILSPVPDNLMFVRVRTRPGMLDYAADAIAHYAIKNNVPVVLTWMRYLMEDMVPGAWRDWYELKTHILNPWWQLKRQHRERLWTELDACNVYQCGTYESSLCRECLNCVRFYWRAIRRQCKHDCPTMA